MDKTGYFRIRYLVIKDNSNYLLGFFLLLTDFNNVLPCHSGIVEL